MAPSFHDHFSERATQYATARPTYPAALAEFLWRVSPTSEVAWESGCGSGQLTRSLAPYFEHYIATDPSIKQLREAPESAALLYCALAEASALPNDCVDLCVAAQAAHWFDLPRYYDEVRRVSRPRGVIALITYGHSRIEPAVDEVIREFNASVLTRYWPPERSHVDAGYETMEFPFERLETPELEMEASWSLGEMVNYINTWSSVQALRKSTGDAALQDFFERLALAWDSSSTKRVVWPLALKVGRI